MDKQPIRQPYTAAAAAEELGLTSTQVYAMIQRGELKTVPVHGKATLITAESVEAAKQKRALEDRS